MAAAHPNSFKARKTLKVGSRSYTYFSLKAVEKEIATSRACPFRCASCWRTCCVARTAPRSRRPHRSLRRLAEERRQVGQGDQLPPGARADAGLHRRAGGRRPRGDAQRHGRAGRRPEEDQSAGALSTSSSITRCRSTTSARQALRQNVEVEFERNRERYQFLRWGQKAFDNFRVVPPGTGIVHQVNLEYLAKVVWTETHGKASPIPTPWSAPTATPR